jgi:hypothetical protein
MDSITPYLSIALGRDFTDIQKKHSAPEVTSCQGVQSDRTHMREKKERDKQFAGLVKLLYSVGQPRRLLSGLKREK